MDTMIMNVSDAVQVEVVPNVAYQFLMSGKEVAKGYGVTENNIRVQKSLYKHELIEGQHFVRGVNIFNTFDAKGATNCKSYDKEVKQPMKIFWTKLGVIRLGFYLHSQQSVVFRNWAEKVILSHLERSEQRMMETASLPATGIDLNSCDTLTLVNELKRRGVKGSITIEF